MGRQEQEKSHETIVAASANSGETAPEAGPTTALPDLVADMLRTMHWNLTDPAPLHYESVEVMQQRRRQGVLAQQAQQQQGEELGAAAAAQGSSSNTTSVNRNATAQPPAPVVIPPIDVTALLRLVKKSAPVQNHPTTAYLAQIATSLLLLGNEYYDEAHNLVLSLSWRGELPYAYGPTVNLQANGSHDDNDEHLQALACYTHCLVHRAEAWHDSEFGMVGWQNADFWAGNTLRYLHGMDKVPLDCVRSGVEALVDSEAAQTFCEQQLQGNFHAWDPRIVTQACRMVVTAERQRRNSHTDENGSGEGAGAEDFFHGPHPLHEFASKAALLELNIIVAHVLQTLGFRGVTHQNEEGKEESTATTATAKEEEPSNDTTTPSSTS